MKIKIENFQSLKNIDLNIKKFTALIGRNNLGKSSATRAVRSVVRNRGDFTRNGEKFSKVTLQIDSSSISRIKGPSIDYEINGKSYRSVGREIPQAVIDFGFKPILLGKERVYVQFPNQFEKVFLLNQPNSVIAETISKISKIDVVNSALKLVSKDRKRHESTLKVRKGDLEGVKSRLKNYERVDDLNDKAEEISNLKQEIEQLEDDLKEIISFVFAIETSSENVKGLLRSTMAEVPDTTQVMIEYETLQDFLKLADVFSSVTNQISNLSIIERVEVPSFPKELYDVFGFIQTSLKDIEHLESRIKTLRKVSSVEISETDSIDEKISKFRHLEVFEQGQQSFQNEIKKIEEEFNFILKELKELEKEISLIKKTEVCPFKETFGCVENW